MVAYDADAGKIWYGEDGTWLASGAPSTGSNPSQTSVTGKAIVAASASGGGSSNVHNYNFGQRPFSYTPPTGFKALNTFNLPDPTIKKPNQYMDATTYTGTGAAQTITNAGGFAPDLVWAKNRSISANHVLVDTSRGAPNYLNSNTTNAEGSSSTVVSAFTSTGFTLGNDGTINGNGNAIVGWQWKESATAGFDIVTYTGNGTSGRTVAHNLGVAPKFTIIKQRNASNAWNVWAYDNNAGDPDSFGELNSTAAWYQNQGSSGPYTVTPSSTVLTLTDYGQVNGNGNTYVAYLWAEIPGFSKFGSYTGNGSSDGVFLYCGFKPRYVLIKCTNNPNDWVVHDTARDTYNTMDKELFPDTSGAEQGANNRMIDCVSNGIKIRTGDNVNNGSGLTYIYAAFAENPFKYANAR
jgi:hypothetical protein